MIESESVESEETAALPYASDVEPGIGGRLRAKIEHFCVDEIPLYEASGEGEHLYINITKEGITSKAVQLSLAKLLSTPQSGVGMAGLKDKNALTTQTFSVHTGFRDEAFVEEASNRIADELGLKVNWAKYHRNKLKTGHLLGNRFAIVVSDVACEASECLDRCSAIATLLQERGVPNYFGPQRFGRRGGNVQQGLDILRGEAHRRDKWLRKFLVGSVQSQLCNVYLAERVRMGLFDRLLSGDVAKKYDTGGMFAVEDLAAEQARYEAHEISFTAPIFGPKMWAAQDESGDLETRILESASLSLEDFERARTSGTRRLGRLFVEDLTIAAHEEGIRLAFSLPKGAYATTVLREFMKNDAESVLEGDLDTEGLE